MPIIPAIKPTISVSALKILPTSRLLAPKLRKIPISFVRSSTEMYVIIPIIIDETTSEIPTKQISTIDIAFIISPIELIRTS